jgi:hypothetical protein
MAKINLESEIRSRIESLAAELAGMVRQEAMASITAALGGPDTRRRGPGRPRGSGRKAGSRRGPGRPRGSGRKKAGRPRGRPAKAPSAATLALAPTVLAHIKANDGTGVTDIAKALKKSSNVIKPVVAKLLADKRIRKTGQRRGTKYHAR